MSFVLSALTGCGYHFAGGGKAPGNIQSIAVEILENRTADIGIETIFTNAILDEFLRWKRLPVKSPGQADGLLGGSIVEIRTQSSTFSSPKKTLQSRVTVTLALALRRKGTNEILWQNRSLSYYEDYLQTGDALATDRLRQEAIRQIAVFLAEKIYQNMFLDF